MIPQPPIPEPLWNTVPPAAQAAILAVFDSLLGRIAELEQRVGDLEARLKLNSTNSSKPPSSDPIGFKRKPPTPPSGRKRGGQPGHPRTQRRLVPAEKVRTITDCRPTDCRRCGHALVGDDPTPLVHQVAELPKIEPLVDEYRLHRLGCPQCGTTTCGTLPEGVPRGVSGPLFRPCWPRWPAATASASDRSSKGPATCSVCRSPPGWFPSSSGSRLRCWKPPTTNWRWMSTTLRRSASMTPRGARTAIRPSCGWS